MINITPSECKSNKIKYYIEWEDKVSVYEDEKIHAIVTENSLTIVSLIKNFEKTGVRYKVGVLNPTFIPVNEMYGIETKFNTLE